MNKTLVSLIVLGAVAISAPAFAKSSPAAPAKGAKIATTKTTTKMAAPLKHKHAKAAAIKKVK